MLKKRYFCVNGVMVGQTLDDGSSVAFQVDALGSVVGTVGADGVVQNTYRYNPFGSLLSKTGTGEDPDVLWVGTQGYWATYRVHSDYYMRARHYGSAEGAWTTIDPMWPKQPPYQYVYSRPLVWVDPSGMCACAWWNLVCRIRCWLNPTPPPPPPTIPPPCQQMINDYYSRSQPTPGYRVNLNWVDNCQDCCETVFVGEDPSGENTCWFGCWDNEFGSNLGLNKESTLETIQEYLIKWLEEHLGEG